MKKVGNYHRTWGREVFLLYCLSTQFVLMLITTVPRIYGSDHRRMRSSIFPPLASPRYKSAITPLLALVLQSIGHQCALLFFFCDLIFYLLTLICCTIVDCSHHSWRNQILNSMDFRRTEKSDLNGLISVDELFIFCACSSRVFGPFWLKWLFAWIEKWIIKSSQEIYS